MKNLLLSTIFIALFALSAFAQTEPPTVTVLQSTADSCADCFNKSRAKDDLIKALEAENKTNLDLRKKEELHNEELLKAVALLTSSEKRNKSFFEKLRSQMGRVLQSATDPKTIATIISVILIVDRLKR